jgi:hypothetical protein
MNWILIFLLFDATTGELKNNNVQHVANQKVCEETGTARTSDIAFAQPGYKLSYMCVAPEDYAPEAKDKPKKKGWKLF